METKLNKNLKNFTTLQTGRWFFLSRFGGNWISNFTVLLAVLRAGFFKSELVFKITCCSLYWCCMCWDSGWLWRRARTGSMSSCCCGSPCSSGERALLLEHLTSVVHPNTLNLDTVSPDPDRRKKPGPSGSETLIQIHWIWILIQNFGPI